MPRAVDARLAARRVLFAGVRDQDLRLRLPGRGTARWTVDLVRAGGRPAAPVAVWDVEGFPGGSVVDVRWNGALDSGAPAEDGRYRFRLHVPGAAPRPIGRPFTALRDFFPVRGPHSYGSAGDRFGAPRAGHLHQGQDVLAACGTPIVAARGGTVRQAGFQAAAGNYVVVDAAGAGSDFVYMHLRAPARVAVGARVVTGQRLGEVGDTGDAVGCHLHFELWTAPGWQAGGRPYDPARRLAVWDAQTGAGRARP